jgi:hypothetical protein
MLCASLAKLNSSATTKTKEQWLIFLDAVDAAKIAVDVMNDVVVAPHAIDAAYEAIDNVDAAMAVIIDVSIIGGFSSIQNELVASGWAMACHWQLFQEDMLKHIV